jgi:hypothetical protein
MKPRKGNPQWHLRPQDLAVAIKLVVSRDKVSNYTELSDQMFLSLSETHASVDRLLASGMLLNESTQAVAFKDIHPSRLLICAFLINGAKYAFPAVIEGPTIGLPTMEVFGLTPTDWDGTGPVWPSPYGKHRGYALLPLYPKLPSAAMQDAKLYEVLSLFDCIRAGQARERELAKARIQKLFGF